MHQVIVGTAGHVDHGKTRLVKALTGIDTDRLKEEQTRGISIELGFAPLWLPNGEQVGIVDVPGHERFIKQMLAGVAGIDLVLLVIAADEGVMPQTKEHLDIIHLLQVKRGIIVITKKDLVDEDWLELMKLEVRDAVKGTVLEEAPLVSVSSVTGEGLAMLKNLIAEVATQTPAKAATGKIRLPIDRVFSITGFGTVITGTLWTGTLRLGDNIEILPKGLLTKIRSLQVHGQKVVMAQAGQRVAANLAGLEVTDIEKGSVLATPNFLKQTFRFDAKLLLLNGVSKNLKNAERVRIYIGTKEVLGKIRLLDTDELEAGQEAFVQIHLENALVTARGDRFVVRSYSPMYTIAGGTVIDPLASKHRRFDASIIEMLELKEQGDPKDLVEDYLLTTRNVTNIKNISKALNLNQSEVEQILNQLAGENKLIALGADLKDAIIANAVIDELFKEVQILLGDYHAKYSLRFGISKEELRSRLFSEIDPKSYNLMLDYWIKQDKINIHSDSICLANWRPKLTDKLEKTIKQIVMEIKTCGLQPQNYSELASVKILNNTEKEEVLNYLIQENLLVKAEEDIYFHKEVLDEAIHKIVDFTKENKAITLAEARDLLQSSRKFVLPILEYMDKKRITRRVGDKRVLISAL